MARAKAYMKGRLTKLYRLLTDRNETPFDSTPNWTRYKRLFKFQQWVRDHLNGMEPHMRDMMMDYYILERDVENSAVVMPVVNGMFKSMLSEEDVATLRGWADVSAT